MVETADKLPPVLVALMKGVVYREDDETRWQALLQLQPRVRDYFATIGLEVMLDEGEGYSYLRQRLATADDDEGLPRLVPRRPLSYPVSLLLALLRKRLTELDNAGSDTRLVLSRDELVEMYRVFFPETANEAGQLDRFDSHLSKVEAMGFLRRYGKKDEDKYEVRRILKAFVDGQWLGRLAEQLEQYRAHATGAAAVEEGA